MLEKSVLMVMMTLTMVAVSSQALGSGAVVSMPTPEGYCAIVSPNELGKSGFKYGIPKIDLIRLASIDQQGDRNVAWYIRASNDPNLFNKTLSVTKEEGAAGLHVFVDNVAKCDQMEKFARVINQKLYLAPKLNCMAGDYGFSLQAIGNSLTLNLTSNSPTPKRISTEGIKITETAGNNPSCKYRLTQVTPDRKAIKICLPANALTEPTTGGLAMNIGGQPVPESARKISCIPEQGFAERSQASINHDETNAPTPAKNIAATK